jgi:hypothetical protein
MAVYEDIYQFENLYRHIKMAARCKRSQGEVIGFELNLAKISGRCIMHLENKSYRPNAYHKFMIYDPKEREIQALSFGDRVVQHSLCDNV